MNKVMGDDRSLKRIQEYDRFLRPMSVKIDTIKCKKKHKHNFKTIYIENNLNSN